MEIGQVLLHVSADEPCGTRSGLRPFDVDVARVVVPSIRSWASKVIRSHLVIDDSIPAHLVFVVDEDVDQVFRNFRSRSTPTSRKMSRASPAA